MGKRTINWTDSTYECYKNNCECSEKCKNFAICNRITRNENLKEPPIKKVVEELLEKGISIPYAVTGGLVNCLSTTEAILLKKIILEGKSVKEISKEIKRTEKSLSDCLVELSSKFSYSFSKRGRSTTHDKESLLKYAKENIIPEMLELEKEGVTC